MTAQIVQSAAEVGIWYIFIAVQGLAIIADFGFQPTLARAFAVGFAGGDGLQKQGLVAVLGNGDSEAEVA